MKAGTSKLARAHRVRLFSPYAEDFAREFGVGDGTKINVIDAVGVTLAAVKGVAQKVHRLEARMARRGINA